MNYRRIILNFLNILKISHIFLLSYKISYLKDVGWQNSVLKQSSIDKNGSPIPWYSYPLLHFIESRLTNEIIVFEFGSGNSTIWWAQHASKVIACEHNQFWIEKLKPLPKNVEIFYKNLDVDYTYFIKEYKEYFDVVIIDGRKRNECIKNCLLSVKKNGIIILDDSERIEYEEGILFLTSCGYRKLDFWGMTPSTATKSCTSIFYKDQNFLGI